jgi:membrane-bound lytic murein transglycosylase B
MQTRIAAVAVAALLVAGCSADPEAGDTTPTPTPSTAAATTVVSTTILPIATTPPTIAQATRITDDLTAPQVAAEVTSAERAAATHDASVGASQQLWYRYLAAHPELDEAVLAAVGDDVRPYVERIVRARELGQARQAADPTPSPPSDTLPAWTIVEPLPEDELLGDYDDAQAATGIAWYWLAAIHLQETRMGRIIGTSSAGAVGPMQFLPETWARCCIGDPTVTRDAILGAATYLSQSGGPGDMQAALHEYNPSDSYVATVTAFAENMRDNPQLYDSYRQWQVFYSSSAGTIRLPIGYSEPQPIDAAAYLVDHPQDAAS